MLTRTIAPMLPVLLIAVAITMLGLGGKSPNEQLTQAPWQWTGTGTQGEPAQSEVPDPSRYTLEFRTDRTFSASADCNTVAGTYRTTPPGRVGPLTSLVLTPGVSTRAVCGPGSLSDVFLDDLAQSTGFSISDGVLKVRLVDGGLMTFRSGG